MPDHDAVATADALHSLAIHLLRRLRREDDRGPLTGPRLSALSVVVYGGPLTLGQLAAAEQVRPPTMVRFVAALEAAGLLAREPNPADGRAPLLRATPEGARVLQEGRTRRIAALAADLAELSVGDLAVVSAAVAILQGFAPARHTSPSPDLATEPAHPSVASTPPPPAV